MQFLKTSSPSAQWDVSWGETFSLQKLPLRMFILDLNLVQAALTEKQWMFHSFWSTVFCKAMPDTEVSYFVVRYFEYSRTEVSKTSSGFPEFVAVFIIIQLNIFITIQCYFWKLSG